MSGYIGTQPIPQSTQTRETFTATASQTSFATGGYQAGYIDVFLNGVKLVDGTDFTATNGSDVVLTTGAASGDTLEVVAYTAFTVADQTFTGDIVMSDGLTVDNDGATVLTVDRATSDGTVIDVQKDGSTVGSIGVQNGDNLRIGGSVADHAGLQFGTNIIYPESGPASNITDGIVDIGNGSGRFKDLYLSGGVYLGGTGSANLLDDYEEGTWTPTIGGSISDPTVTYGTTRYGGYVKIGRQVTVSVNVVTTGTFSGGSGGAVIKGLPFTPSSDSICHTGALETDTTTLSSGYTYAYVAMFSSNAVIYHRQGGSGQNEIGIPVGNLTANSWQRMSITYFTDA